MRIVASALIITLFLASCAGTDDRSTVEEPVAAPESAEEVTAAIEAAYVRMVDGMASGDVSGMVQTLYTPDARFHPPLAGPVEGRDAIAATLSAVLDTGVRISPSPVHVDVFGDVAFEYGIGEITEPNGEVDRGTYVVLWKKVDGNWMIHRDFVSGSTP